MPPFLLYTIYCHEFLHRLPADDEDIRGIAFALSAPFVLKCSASSLIVCIEIGHDSQETNVSTKGHTHSRRGFFVKPRARIRLSQNDILLLASELLQPQGQP